MKALRKLMREADVRLTRMDATSRREQAPEDAAAAERYRKLIERFDADELSRAYIKIHGQRLARTLTLVPPPGESGRILELGCYMQMTPLLETELGYAQVEGGYFGELGESDTRVANIDGVEQFRCRIKKFDAETDRYPYGDGSFDTVLACEIIEHLQRDPMHLLLESRRVLADGGALLLTTPNCASLASIARALKGESPQVFAQYSNPERGEQRGAHVREYTPWELEKMFACAGFEVETTFTERFEGVTTDTWVLEMLERDGFSTEFRGEQIYAIARKAGAPGERYPEFLYCD